jgi:hypothetical protein
VVLERPDLARFHLSEPEVLENRPLRLLVDPPLAVDALGDTGFAAVERRDDLLHAFGRECRQRVRSRISAARAHSCSVGTRASRQ